MASHQESIILKRCNLRKCALLALAASPRTHRHCYCCLRPTTSRGTIELPACTVRCERGREIPELHLHARRGNPCTGKEAALLVGGDALPLAGVVVAAREAIAVGIVAGVERVHVVADLDWRKAASGTVCRRTRRGIST